MDRPSPEVVAAAEQYRCCWDGSEPGWTLERVHHCDWEVVYLFGPEGPTTRETLHLRGCRDELRNLPMKDVLRVVRGRSEYVAPWIASNLQGRWAKEKAEKAGLRVELRPVDRSGTFPLRNCRYLKIEDDAVAAVVVRRMRAAGVPESVVEVD